MSVCPLHNMIKRLLCRKGCKRNAKRTHTESQYCNIFGRSPQNCFFLLQMMTSLYSMWLCNYACIIQYVHYKTICRHLLKWILTSLQVFLNNDLFEKYSGVSPSLFFWLHPKYSETSMVVWSVKLSCVNSCQGPFIVCLTFFIYCISNVSNNSWLDLAPSAHSVPYICHFLATLVALHFTLVSKSLGRVSD